MKEARLRFIRLSGRARERMIERTVLFLAGQENIKFAFLFGGFLDSPVFRDMDIGLFVKDMAPAEFWEYESELSLELRRILKSGFDIDVKIINRAPLSLRFKVVNGRLIFWRDEECLVDFMTDTAKQYLDMAPLRFRYMREAMVW